jgi:signal transduction histidine kinase
MSDGSRPIEERLRKAFDQSADTVRKAHERAEQAAERARLLRRAMKELQTRRPEPSTSATALHLAIEEHERSARENERFIAIVSHELRQPLNAIIAAHEILDANAPPETKKAATTVMRRQLRHMSRLIDNLLELSRLSVQNLRLELRPTDLMPVVEFALETVAERVTTARLDVHIDFPRESIVVNADGARLQQVLSNVLSNAVRYTPNGGRVRVSAETDDGWAHVRVADTGQGIDAADIQNIFEPFARGGRGSSDGFGIGLALVKGLVELHGGRVAVESEGRGRGSTFEIALPLAHATAEK